jgi:Carboxylesterase family
LDSQAQYVAADRSEVWVNVGYRLSVFGFLACDEPRIEGNFGFKDQWMAFEWIHDNIGTFGGMMGGLSDARNSHFILQHDRRPKKYSNHRVISRWA